MATIKAIRIHNFDGIGQIRYEDIPRPAPGPDDVLIRVHAAGVNPVDWQLTHGINQEFLQRSLPTVPGFEVAGVVEEIGGAVTTLAIGDAVYGHVDFRYDGSFAEYMVSAQDRLVAKPANLGFVEAAAVPVAALAAWTALFDPEGVNLQPGQDLLITGAAGGVGTFAVQFAKWARARVIATGSDYNRDFLLELGADQFIDYHTQSMDAAGPLDAVLEAVGGQTQLDCLAALRPAGVLASLVGEQWGDPEVRPDIKKFVVHGGFYPQQLATITSLLESGEVRPIISQVLPLSAAREALEISSAGHVRGKIVLSVQE